MIRYALPIVVVLLAGCPTPEEQSVDVFTEAQLFDDEGDVEKAIAGYGLAIELDPDNAEAFLHRAEARLVSGDLDGAFEDCNKAIQLAPDAADAYRARDADASQRNPGHLTAFGFHAGESVSELVHGLWKEFGMFFHLIIKKLANPFWVLPDFLIGTQTVSG